MDRGTAAFGRPATAIKKASLIVISGIDSEVNVVEINKNSVLGRVAPGSNPDIPVDSLIVSRSHGVFKIEPDGIYYCDLENLNGTYINGMKLGKSDKGYRLSDGDILRIDRRDLKNPHKDAVTIIFSTSFDKRSKWRCIPMDNTHDFILGRNMTMTLDFEFEKIVEKIASFTQTKDGCVLKSCVPKAVFAVNNKRAASGMRIYDRDVMRIGNDYIMYADGKFLYSACMATIPGLSVDIAATNVSEGFGTKTLLKDIHAEVDRGDFALIIGGSGAGKSTLINSILGKYKIEGVIKLGGEIVTAGSPALARIAYVPQTLPIRKEERLIDVVSDTALLRMNGKMSAKEREKFIYDTLDSLGLKSKAKSEIKKLSGGEQRRAAIANEVVTNSDIFFLDEPDSGLDPKSGMELMNMLKGLSDKGKMVMLISHNYASYPNPEKIYTKIVILAKSNIDGIGRLAFMGTVKEALEFFGVSELKDITKLINPKSENGEGRADEFVEKYRRLRAR